MTGLTIAGTRCRATFRPDRAMLCTSLRAGDAEFVAWPRTLSQFREGGATAIPLLHPWANRLGGWEYECAGQRVDLSGQRLPTDPNGLPIHGNLYGAPFDVERSTDDSLRASLDYGMQPEKLAAFPFPHRVTIDARIDDDTLRLTTTVFANAGVDVPVSFGWHPFLTLPDMPRREWILRWPACEHIELDAHMIPTGARTAQAAAAAPLGRRQFDDHYALGSDRTFGIAAGPHALTLEYDEHYPFAQLFVPPRRHHVAIEPMTAAVDALRRGTTPIVRAGAEFAATFSIRVESR